MFELYKNEIKRLKYWIIIPSFVYLLLNAASIYFGEYADSGLMIGNFHSVLFAIVSGLMGLVQFHAYKKDNRWVYLINRPIPLSSLCLSLIAAAATIVLLQFVVVDLLITLTMDSITHFVIEKRHYYQVFYVFFISMAFYLAGVYIQLCHSKGAFLVIILPVFAVISLLLEGPAIFISMIVSLWLLLLVLTVFKANINNNQTHLFGKILAVIPYQLGLFIILSLLLSFLMQLRYMLIDGAGIDISWNEYFANDVHKHVRHLEGNEQLALNLIEADSSIQKQYIAQLNNVKAVSIYPEIKSHYTRSLMPYQQKIYQMNIIDKVNDEEWVFSMDKMLFINQKQTQNGFKLLGISNENGQVKAFESVPTLRTKFGVRQVITKNQIYIYDTDFQKLNLRVSIPNDETLITGLHAIGSTLGLITTKSFYLYNAKKMQYSSGLLVPEKVVNIPGAHENLNQVEIAEMIDSTLLGFLFGKTRSTGYFSAKQVAIELKTDTNSPTTLAVRPLKQGFSELYYKMDWVVSPVIQWSYQNAIKPLLKSDPIDPRSPQIPIKLGNTILVLIVIVTLISVFLTFWFSKNRTKTTTQRWSWIGLTVITSIIGFLTFMLLSDKSIKLNIIKEEIES